MVRRRDASSRSNAVQSVVMVARIPQPQRPALGGTSRPAIMTGDDNPDRQARDRDDPCPDQGPRPRDARRGAEWRRPRARRLPADPEARAVPARGLVQDAGRVHQPAHARDPGGRRGGRLGRQSRRRRRVRGHAARRARPHLRAHRVLAREGEAHPGLRRRPRRGRRPLCRRARGQRGLDGAVGRPAGTRLRPGGDAAGPGHARARAVAAGAGPRHAAGRRGRGRVDRRHRGVVRGNAEGDRRGARGRADADQTRSRPASRSTPRPEGSPPTHSPRAASAS